ncbi:MAG: HlyC/CorC family transporter, partial [Clostridia bacterium]|nr:HlyC/CorC family transporter [Clostridia bacterium]
MNSLLLSAQFFTVSNILTIIGIILLLTISAFFSASEIAFSSSSNIRIRNFAEENTKGARKALYIQEHFDNALSTILVGNNFVNILSTTLCGYLFAKVIFNPVLYNIINTVIMTIVILIFGEILPKSVAKINPEKTALNLAPILYVVMKVMFIICYPFNLIQKALKKKTEENQKPTITEDELETIVETMEDEGVIDEQNADIIFGALKFSDVSVKDIMTPRVDVICINVNSSIEEIKDVFLKNQFSRLPVFDKSKDNIIGILNQKDFFSAIIGKEKVNIRNMITPALFVTKGTKVNSVMRLMQKEKKHMVIVSDEYGGTSGVVTMEDCFEEVFGEVYDEHDDSIVNTISKIEENKYLVNAELSVEELFDYLEIERMPDNQYSSIASFLCEISKKIPQQESVISYKTIDEVIDEDSKFIEKKITMNFKLTRVEKRRIREVELTII